MAKSTEIYQEESVAETSPLLGTPGPQSLQYRSTTSSTASDDTGPLCHEYSPKSADDFDPAATFRIVLVLLIAVFIYHADHSLVLATHPTIASDFDALPWSSWLFTSFGLAGAATQTIIGKLGDIYGRKPMILISYAGFASGCLVVAVGQSMGVVILGRVLSGSVGAGMTVLVSITVSDLVPLRESGNWRAYVNVAATTGRGFGGPIGGWLTDAVGWRWSFGCQIPMLILAFYLCWKTLPARLNDCQDDDGSYIEDQKPVPGKLSRIDGWGSLLLAVSILLFLLPLELGGVEVPWQHPLIPALFVGAGLTLALFVLVEKRWAMEPVLDLGLFKNRDVLLGLVIMLCQTAAQVGVVFCVPLYFQITAKASNSEAGVHLFPSVIGSAAGGIVSGYVIRRTGRYKSMIILSLLTGTASYALMLLRWRGQTNWWEAMYILPGGFGMGTAHTALFISTQASAELDQASNAVSTLLLSNAIGIILGVATLSTVMKEVLRRSLEGKLAGLGIDQIARQDVLGKAVANIEYAANAGGEIGKAIVEAYVDGLSTAFGVALLFMGVGFCSVLFLRERKLMS